MEFVVESLVEIFDYAPTTAESLTIKVHEEGAATVAVLPYEMAEQKGIEVTVSARSARLSIYKLNWSQKPNLPVFQCAWGSKRACTNQCHCVL